jgi:cobalt-zinc-cadmium efflux system membrane fusion protein
MVDQTGLTPWQMLTIVDSTKVSVDAQAYEKDMIALRVGESVTVTTDALPHFAATGNVQFVAPGLDPNSHTLPVKAVLDNSLGKLKDGMYVSVTVDIGHVSPFPPRPIVPLTAVLHDGQDDYVYVVIGEGKYDRRKVTLGEQRGEDRVAIESGLTGEETIVTHGALYLGTGATPGN